MEESDEACCVNVRIVGATRSREEDRFIIDVDRMEGVPITRAEGVLVRVPDSRILRLTERLGALQTGDLWSVAAELEADLGELADGPFYEIPQRLVERASRDGRLRELWQSTEFRHGQQELVNPFDEAGTARGLNGGACSTALRRQVDRPSNC